MFESSEEIAQNKLILLYLLKSINISVTNSEMCQFALEKRIMDYFSVQSCIEELCETGLFHSYKENGFTWYEITDEGTDMLELFAQKIPNWMKVCAQDYIKNNEERLRNEFEMNASIEERNGDYYVSCKIYGDNRSVMMEIGVAVPDESFAKKICENWKENSEDIYIKVLNILTEDKKQE